jgi:hypothetical protein
MTLARIEALRGEEVLDLHQIDGAYLRTSEDGFGLAPVRRLTERGPLQDGLSDIGFRLDARQIALVFDVDAEDIVSYYAACDALLDMFKPSLVPLRLRYTREDGAVRQIDVHYSGQMRYSSQDRRALYRSVAIELVAPDPTLYDPTAEQYSFGIAAGGSALTVPTPVPTPVGTSTVNQTTTITYGGRWKTYPEIRIVGPITGPVIRNLATNEQLAFPNVTIPAGTEYLIDTRYGYKTIRTASGVNKIGDLSADSDLAGFHIAAAPEAPQGLNSFQVTGNGANSQTQVYVFFYKRFIAL